MSNKLLERIMDIMALDLGQKKVLSSIKKISLANIVYVLGKPIRNRVIVHCDVYDELCNNNIDSKYTLKVEEELYFLAETDPNMFGAKYETVKKNTKVLHSKGNSLRIFISREKATVKVLAICKVENWHKDEDKVVTQTSQRMNNWKNADY